MTFQGMESLKNILHFMRELLGSKNEKKPTLKTELSSLKLKKLLLSQEELPKLQKPHILIFLYKKLLINFSKNTLGQ